MTSQLQDAERLLRALTRAEEAQIVAWLSSDRSGAETPGIEQTPNVCGGAACIVGKRIPVWMLCEARLAGMSDESILTLHKSLTRDHLAAAWEYARTHEAEVRERIRLNRGT